MIDTKPVAGYYRVSVARDDMKAPELYESEIRRYCSYKGVALADIFSDLDYSGYRRSENRPALNELVSRRHEFSAVVIPKLARFGRSLKHLTRLFEVFDTDGIPLVFLDIDLDTSTSQGRLLRHIMAAFAEYESDVRSDYSRAAHALRAERGLPNGTAPFGYRRIKGGLEIDPARAALVNEIYDLYVAGMSMRRIARLFTDRGIPGPATTHWGLPTVRNILINPAYIGLRRHRDQLSPGNWHAIVAIDKWEAVQKRRFEHWPPPGVNVRNPMYLLSGLISCGVCGNNLYHRPKSDRPVGGYYCQPRPGRRCRGMFISDHLAHEQIETALLERYGSSSLVTEDRVVNVRDAWDRGDLSARHALIKLAVTRIEAIARPADNRRGKGLPRAGRLKISWADEGPGRVVQGRGGARIDVPVHTRQSWAEFHRESLRSQTPKEGDSPERRRRRKAANAARSVDATAAETIVSSKGKTWAQWQRELRAAR